IKNAFDDLSLGDFGDRIVNLMNSDSKTFMDEIQASNQMDLNWWLDGTDPDLHGWNEDAFQRAFKSEQQQPVNIDFTAGEHVIPEIGLNWGSKNRVPQNE